MDRMAGAGTLPSRSRSETDVRGSGQVVNPDLAMYDNLRQRPSRCDSTHARQESWAIPHRRLLYTCTDYRTLGW